MTLPDLTLPQMLREQARLQPAKVALRQKDFGIWKPLTWQAYAQRAEHVGLGLRASRARRVTDTMLIAAGRELARHSPVLRDPTAALLPPLGELRDIAREVAFAVGREAQRAGVAPEADSEEEFRAQIALSQWAPSYPAAT